MNQKLLLLLILSVSLLSTFYLFKFRATNYLSTYDEYYHVGAINGVRESKYSLEDLRNIFPLDYILAFSDNYIFLFRFLPFIFGLVNILLLYLLLNKVIIQKVHIYITLLLIILSPIHIFFYSTFNTYFFPFSLILMGTLLLLNDRYILSVLIYIMAIAFNPQIFFIIVVILMVCYEKLKISNLFFSLSVLILFTYLFIINTPSKPGILTFHSLAINYFSDFGASIGIGVFSYILGIIGLVLSWKNKKEYAIVYCGLLVLCIYSIFSSMMLLFFDMVFSFFGGLAFVKLLNGNWQSSTLKNYVILLSLCGLIFSSGSFINRFSQSGPDTREIVSLEWLKNKITNQEKVFSYYEYGFLIHAYSGAEVYTDKRYYQSSKDKIRIIASQDIFNSRDLKYILTFLNKNNLEYIWINKRMKNGEVWSKNDDGLLLVLANSINFKRIYNYKDIEIWQKTNSPLTQ